MKNIFTILLISILGAVFSFSLKAEPIVTQKPNMQVYVIRLSPGDDPKIKIQAFVSEKKMKAAMILSAVGSLTKANLRYANQEKVKTLKGHFEIVSLSGMLSAENGSHLHMSISDEKGKTTGGHLSEGSIVYTTLEVAIGELNDVQFLRELDSATTYKELKITPVSTPK